MHKESEESEEVEIDDPMAANESVTFDTSAINNSSQRPSSVAGMSTTPW